MADPDNPQIICTLAVRNGVTELDNARLIAAAPELLEALKELHDLVEENMIGAYKFDSFTLQVARLAIAKSEGK